MLSRNQRTRRAIFAVAVVVVLVITYVYLPFILPIPEELLKYQSPDKPVFVPPSTFSYDDAFAEIERWEKIEKTADNWAPYFAGRDKRYVDGLQPTIDILASIEGTYHPGMLSGRMRFLANKADAELAVARRRVPEAELSIAALQGAIWRFQEAANCLDYDVAEAAYSGKPRDDYSSKRRMEEAAHYLDRVMIFVGKK